MRGDSLRDLYAKTLAVVGLGLLAGAGALVDYWPVGGELPALPASAALTSSVPVLAQDLQRDIPAPRLTRASVVSIARVTPDSFAGSLRSIDFVPAAQPVALFESQSNPLPDPGFIRVDESASVLLASMAVMLSLEPVPDMVDVAVAPGDPVDDANHPFTFTGAIRKTRESLKGARLFLGDKLQGVVGAFRRVSPFWDSTVLEFR